MCRKQPATEHYIGNTVPWHPAAFCHVNHSPFNNDMDAGLLRGGEGSSDHYTPANIIRVNYPISTETDLIREQGASMLFKCCFSTGDQKWAQENIQLLTTSTQHPAALGP